MRHIIVMSSLYKIRDNMMSHATHVGRNSDPTSNMFLVWTGMVLMVMTLRLRLSFMSHSILSSRVVRVRTCSKSSSLIMDSASSSMLEMELEQILRRES